MPSGGASPPRECHASVRLYPQRFTPMLALAAHLSLLSGVSSRPASKEQNKDAQQVKQAMSVLPTGPEKYSVI